MALTVVRGDETTSNAVRRPITVALGAGAAPEAAAHLQHRPPSLMTQSGSSGTARGQRRPVVGQHVLLAVHYTVRY